jgi:hypothetical protein
VILGGDDGPASGLSRRPCSAIAPAALPGGGERGARRLGNRAGAVGRGSLDTAGGVEGFLRGVTEDRRARRPAGPHHWFITRSRQACAPQLAEITAHLSTPVMPVTSRRHVSPALHGPSPASGPADIDMVAAYPTSLHCAITWMRRPGKRGREAAVPQPAEADRMQACRQMSQAMCRGACFAPYVRLKALPMGRLGRPPDQAVGPRASLLQDVERAAKRDHDMGCRHRESSAGCWACREVGLRAIARHGRRPGR